MKFTLLPMAAMLLAGYCASANLHKVMPAAALKPNTTTISEPQPLPEPEKVGFKKDKKLGKKLTQSGDVTNALRFYEEAIHKKPKQTILYQPIADGYYALRNYKVANQYYKILVDGDSVKHKTPANLYRYAMTQKLMGNYEDAKLTFDRFVSLAHGNDLYADLVRNSKLESQGCDLGIAQRDDKKDIPPYKLMRLDTSINKPYANESPFAADQRTLYFTRRDSDKKMVENKKIKYGTFSRIYVSQKHGNTWGPPELLKGGINAVDYHTGDATISADGKTMYYTQCMQDDQLRMRCNIYKSVMQDNTGWSAGVILDNNVNEKNASTVNPALGKNETGDNVIYFSSDRNTGRGMDLFYSKVNADGTFGAAHALSTGVNTRGDEVAPYYDAETNTLYFSSNGLTSIGGFDIFKTNVKAGEWTEPVNLGMPLNSSVDDIYFTWNENGGRGFMVTNRPGTDSSGCLTCTDNIYQVNVNVINLAVLGKVQDGDNGNAPVKGGIVKLMDNITGDQIKIFDANNGYYFFDLKPDKDYKLVALSEGYEEMIVPLSTLGDRTDDTMTIDLTLRQLPKPKTRVSDNLGTAYWEFNKDILTDGAPDTLNKVIALMTDNPEWVVEVGSHTDGKGSDKYNMGLSQRRSDRVVKYLLSRKIPKDHLKSKAYGKTMPVAPNTTPDGKDNPEGRSMNRRTEFKVLELQKPAEAEGKK